MTEPRDLIRAFESELDRALASRSIFTFDADESLDWRRTSMSRRSPIRNIR